MRLCRVRFEHGLRPVQLSRFEFYVAERSNSGRLLISFAVTSHDRTSRDVFYRPLIHSNTLPCYLCWLFQLKHLKLSSCFQSLLQRMRLDNSVVITVQDKDPKILCIQDAALAASRFVQDLQSSKRWRIASILLCRCFSALLSAA